MGWSAAALLWQFDSEDGALRLIVLDLDRAVVVVDDAVHDGEAEASAPGASRVEGVEDPTEGLIRNARPGVLDHHLQDRRATGTSTASQPIGPSPNIRPGTHERVVGAAARGQAAALLRTLTMVT